MAPFVPGLLIFNDLISNLNHFYPVNISSAVYLKRRGGEMDYRFCPYCGMRIKSIDNKQNNFPHIFCSRCEFKLYQHPKPCVGAVITQDNCMILVQRANAPYQFYWDFPGGFLELNEHPKDGLKREVSEELGADVYVDKLIGVYMDNYGNLKESTLNIYYSCMLLDNVDMLSEEINGAEWFDLENLPKKIAFRHFRKLLNDWRYIQSELTS